MYNRYVGNTGKFYRVEERHDRPEKAVEISAHAPHDSKKAPGAPGHPHNAGKPALFGSGFTDLTLPFGLDTGDLVILALLIFLYFESKDEEFLIMLGVLAYGIYSEYKEK